jgi:hypothetical protein
MSDSTLEEVTTPVGFESSSSDPHALRPTHTKPVSAARASKSEAKQDIRPLL